MKVMSLASILVLEPEVDTQNCLAASLVDAGFDVSIAANGREAREATSAARFDLAILEIQLPGEDGLQIIRDLFVAKGLPSIVVSKRSKPIHKILALEIGADDFVTKPFDVDEVLSRVRAVLRRTTRSNTALKNDQIPIDKSYTDVYRFDGLEFDLGRRELKKQCGQAIDLTSAEIDLLGAFVKHPMVPLSRGSIIDQMGNLGDASSLRTIDVLISKLRRKIEPGTEHPEIIKTVRGAGYVFAPKVFGH